jgi:predicted RNA-binding Zn-ribbon protein involved in translation (DUF1610 family)
MQNMIKPRAIRKLPECVSCRFYSGSPFIVCAILPAGPVGAECPHFAPDPNAEPVELWEPEGATYYNGELVLQPPQRWSREQQLELLDTHPLFTGKCPQCGAEFDRDYTARVHWDCECGWMDDSV